METNGKSHIDRIEAVLEKMVGAVTALADHVNHNDRFLRRIAESQVHLAEAQLRLA